MNSSDFFEYRSLPVYNKRAGVGSMVCLAILITVSPRVLSHSS